MDETSIMIITCFLFGLAGLISILLLSILLKGLQWLIVYVVFATKEYIYYKNGKLHDLLAKIFKK